MSLGGRNYNEASAFATERSTDEYIDSAIARNIQHSLACYQDGGHFRSLQKLFDSDELTSVINRVVEDVNHCFALDVLSRDPKSHDLALSARNLRMDRRSRPTFSIAWTSPPSRSACENFWRCAIPASERWCCRKGMLPRSRIT